ncbi:MAG: 8-amino-7-oxononanoate synthase [Pseudomonadota bacterium]
MLNLKDDLRSIQEKGLYRKLTTVCSPSGPRVRIDGRDVLMMASNDYLGLCCHPRIIKRAQEALELWGAGSGASRLISGNSPLFCELEHKLANFKQTEAALVFSTGYMANAGILTALAGEHDVIYSDELNHASIIDGCRLSRAKVEIYPHCRMNALQGLLEKSPGYRRRLIVTDGIFSMDGDMAPVPDLLSLARRYDAALIIDDAHGTGVLGARGKGILEHFGLSGETDITVMGTLGKALGCFGAFVAGSSDVKELLINCSRSFIFTTALPPAVIASALEALQIVEDEPEQRTKLASSVLFMQKGLKEIGFNTLQSCTQIMPIMIGNPETAVAMARHLFEQGLFIQAIRPPTVPEGSSRLRLTVMATHTRQDMEQALDILKKAGEKFRII